MILSKIKEKYRDEQLNDSDGIRIDFNREWVQLRKSNTEPIIRIYSESNNAENAESLARKIIADIKEITG
jgi:phosphomannomutase